MAGNPNEHRTTVIFDEELGEALKAAHTNTGEAQADIIRNALYLLKKLGEMGIEHRVPIRTKDDENIDIFIPFNLSKAFPPKPTK